jgi:hypothetical protein
MGFAKIYTDNTKFKAISFFDVVPTSDFIYDSTTPSLIIGRNNAEKLVGKDNVKLLNKEIKENLYWTFSKMEKRSQFEVDIEAFYSNCFKKIFKNITYEPINLYTCTINDIKFLINAIKTGENRIYITEKNIFIPVDGKIYGVSVDEIEFIGVKCEKVIKMIEKNPKNRIFRKNNYFDIKKYIGDNEIIISYLHNISKK